VYFDTCRYLNELIVALKHDPITLKSTQVAELACLNSPHVTEHRDEVFLATLLAQMKFVLKNTVDDEVLTPA
jgi:hypothetical protein